MLSSTAGPLRQSWPFVLKLFWAPLVDSVYVRRIGRRKCSGRVSPPVAPLEIRNFSTLVDDHRKLENHRKTIGKP